MNIRNTNCYFITASFSTYSLSGEINFSLAVKQFTFVAASFNLDSERKHFKIWDT